MLPADNTPANQTKLDRTLLLILATGALLFSCSMTVADPDLWGHTLYGLRAADQGVFAESHDPFSYTAAGQTWINHEWLTEYQFGWLWRNYGGIGLWMWRNQLAVIVFVVAVVAIRQANAGLGTATLLLLFAAESLSTFFIFIRPQLATLALFAVFLWLLKNHWETPDWKLLIALPPLMALWVNLHGGFLAGLAIQFVFAGGWVLRTIFQREVRSAAVFALFITMLSAAATLVNPYGWTMHSMLWQHLVPEQAVAEWQPLWGAKQAVVYYLPFILLGIALVGWRRWKAIDLLVMVFVTYAAVKHIRHGALLCIAVLVLLPAQVQLGLETLFPNLIERFSAGMSRSRRIGGVAAALTLLFGTLLPGLLDFCRNGIAPWAIAVETKRSPPGVPARAIALIRDENLHGNLVTDYAWGQYVLWHLYPETKVAFDGRYRTIFPEKLEQEFLSFLKTDQQGPETLPLLDNYATELVLLPVNTPVCDYLKQRPDWVCVLKDEQAVLFVKDIPRFRESIDRLILMGPSVPEPRRWLVFPGLEPTSSEVFTTFPKVNSSPEKTLACEVQLTGAASILGFDCASEKTSSRQSHQLGDGVSLTTRNR